MNEPSPGGGTGIGPTEDATMSNTDASTLHTEVSEALNTGTATVARGRKRFVEEGFEAALSEKSRPGARPKLSGKQQAHIIALSCSKAPEGHARWTLRLLANKVVELGFSEQYSYDSVRRLMKKTLSSRGKRQSGAFQK